MKKCLIAIGFTLLVVSGCSDDKEKKNEAIKQAVPDKQETRGQSKQGTGESKHEPAQPKTKMELTDEKLNEVKSLKEKLKQKKEILDNKAIKFAAHIRANVDEINAERIKNGIKEFPQAVSNAIIEQCLKALQKAKAYKELSQREAQKTWLAVIEVTGAEKQLRLDKTLFEDLDDAQIEELLRQIDFVLNKVKPQAEEFQVTDEETVREPLEKLYEEYIRKDEREREQRELNQKRQEERSQKEAAEAARKKAAEEAKRAEAKRQREFNNEIHEIISIAKSSPDMNQGATMAIMLQLLLLE